MTQPNTLRQYKKFFANLGISWLDIRAKYGDLRKLATWKQAYSDYTYEKLPLIKFLDGLAPEETDFTSPEAIAPPAEVLEVEKTVETVETVVWEDQPTTFPLPKFPPILLAETPRENSGFNKSEVLEVVDTIFGNLIRLTKLPTLNLVIQSTFYQLPTPLRLGRVIAVCWRYLRVKTSLKLPRRYRGAAIAPDTS